MYNLWVWSAHAALYGHALRSISNWLEIHSTIYIYAKIEKCPIVVMYVVNSSIWKKWQNCSNTTGVNEIFIENGMHKIRWRNRRFAKNYLYIKIIIISKCKIGITLLFLWTIIVFPLIWKKLCAHRVCSFTVKGSFLNFMILNQIDGFVCSNFFCYWKSSS